ncbi:MAG: type II toxin-antitoxin system prevent-host-death family antitoxin [Acidobacteriota bacterium]
MCEVGVRELKTHLSEYLRRVKKGETVTITDHGQSVGRIVPAAMPLEKRLLALQEAGMVAWNGHKLKNRAPSARSRGRRTVSELLVEDRE